MRVSRLEVFGFKSFMERLVLPLDGGITGVVGPNGCGKSNIVDAIRWVLGETRARELRGGVLEDVIFNGTDALRPLGLAEVTLTLKADEGDFFTALAKAEVLPADPEVEAETPGEEPVVLATEQREPTRPHLSVIMGNKTDSPKVDDAQVVAATSLDSTSGSELPPSEEVIAEAAPQEEAPATSARFGWLKSVTEIQITRRLYRSGESEFFINRVACRLRDLKELFRAVHLGARAYTIIAQGEVGRVVNAKPEDRRLIFEEAAGVSGFRDKIAEAKRRLEEARSGVARVDDIVRELTRQVQVLKRKAERATERDGVKQEVLVLERKVFLHSIFDLTKRAAHVTQQLNQVTLGEGEAQTALEEATEQERLLRASFGDVDHESAAIRRKIEVIRDELAKHSRRVNERRSVLNEVRALIKAHEGEVSRVSEREEMLKKRFSQSEAEVVTLTAQERDVTEKLAQADKGSEDDLRLMAQKLATLREQIKGKDKAHREARDTVVALRSRVQSIKEQLVAASPLRQLSKSVGSKAFQELNLEGSRPIVDALNVPAQLVKAVQSVLAEKANYLIAEDPHGVGARFVHHLERLPERERKGLGVGVLQVGEGVSVASDTVVGLKPLRTLIGVESFASKAADLLFANVFVAGTLAEAQQFFGGQQVADDVTVVTEDGDLLTANSFYSLRHDGGLVSLRTKEVELETAFGEAQANYDKLHQDREEHLKAINEAESAHAELMRETQRRQAVVRELGREQGSIRGRLQAAARLVEQIKSDLARMERESGDSTKKKTELSTREIGVAQEVAELESASTEGPELELNELRKALEESEQQRTAARSQMNQISNLLNEKRKALELMRRTQNDLRIQSERFVIERRNTIDRLVNENSEEYAQQLLAEVESPTAESSAPNVSDEELRRDRERLLALKRRLQREGEVDPTSIQAFEEENARLTELLSQKQDLEQGAKVLSQSVQQIVTGAEKRLMHTFTIVQEKFQELIPRVFGGGSGSLELSNAGNPLESGVTIMVRPPGKAPKSIDVLSGGEKALTATALIMALFSHAPSPLCVLDEVDAPLDEANLLRFLDLIRDMSKKTQFIMVTHNKQSMTLSDRLVGVTMEQPGASKMISVSLQEAVAQVA